MPASNGPPSSPGSGAATTWATAALMLLVAGRTAGLGAATSWLLDGTWWLNSEAAPAARPGPAGGRDARRGRAVARSRCCARTPAAEGHSATEHGRAAALVAEYGVDSLDPFALRPDKSFHFGAVASSRIAPSAARRSSGRSPSARRVPHRRILASSGGRGQPARIVRGDYRGQRPLLDGLPATRSPNAVIGEEAVRRSVGLLVGGGPDLDRAQGRRTPAATRLEHRCDRGSDLDAVYPSRNWTLFEQAWRAAQPADRLRDDARPAVGRGGGRSQPVRGSSELRRVYPCVVRFGVYRGGLSLDVDPPPRRESPERPDGNPRWWPWSDVSAQAEGLRRRAAASPGPRAPEGSATASDTPRSDEAAAAGASMTASNSSAWSR